MLVSFFIKILFRILYEQIHSNPNNYQWPNHIKIDDRNSGKYIDSEYIFERVDSSYYDEGKSKVHLGVVFHRG